MVRVQARSQVFAIVVEREQLAGGVGELEHRIQGGIEPARLDFRDHHVVRFSGELEHGPVPRLVHASVKDDGQGNLLRVRRRVVWFLVESIRQCVQRERHAVGNESLPARHERLDSRFGVLGRQSQRLLLEIPTVHFGRQRRPRLASQRKEARHKRQFPDADAIYEILSPAVDAVVDCEHIFAVLGHFKQDGRVGLEPVIVVIRRLFPARVVEHEHGLEPAGNGVGNIREQLPGQGGEDQPLAFAGREAVAVRLAGGDLPVDGARHRDSIFDLGGRPSAEGLFLLAEHLFRGRGHGFPGILRQLTHMEREWIGDTLGRGQPEFPLARLGVGRNRDLEDDQAGDRIAGRRLHVFARPLLELGEQLLGAAILVRRRRLLFRVCCRHHHGAFRGHHRGAGFHRVHHRSLRGAGCGLRLF